MPDTATTSQTPANDTSRCLAIQAAYSAILRGDLEEAAVMIRMYHRVDILTDGDVALLDMHLTIGVMG